MTMTLVSTVTVGAGGAASINFTSIPQTGTDLLLVLSARTTQNASSPIMRFNTDSTVANYGNRYLMGNGAAASSATNTTSAGISLQNAYNNGTYTASTFSNVQIYLPNYASSTSKTVSVDAVTENNATTAQQAVIAGTWTGTAGINAILIYGYTLAEYSTASLYTITKGSGGATVS